MSPVEPSHLGDRVQYSTKTICSKTLKIESAYLTERSVTQRTTPACAARAGRWRDCVGFGPPLPSRPDTGRSPSSTWAGVVWPPLGLDMPGMAGYGRSASVEESPRLDPVQRLEPPNIAA